MGRTAISRTSSQRTITILPRLQSIFYSFGIRSAMIICTSAWPQRRFDSPEPCPGSVMRGVRTGRGPASVRSGRMVLHARARFLVESREIRVERTGPAVSNRRIHEGEMLRQEVAAWIDKRNAVLAGVNWQFAIADERTKLKRLYHASELQRSIQIPYFKRTQSQRIA